MLFKEGVDISCITKETIQAMVKASYIFTARNSLPFVVTSVCDGKHMEGSKHYEGNAFDIRTWTNRDDGIQLRGWLKRAIADELRYELGNDYDVVVEDTHIHVEYDKK